MFADGEIKPWLVSIWRRLSLYYFHYGHFSVSLFSFLPRTRSFTHFYPCARALLAPCTLSFRLHSYELLSPPPFSYYILSSYARSRMCAHVCAVCPLIPHYLCILRNARARGFPAIPSRLRNSGEMPRCSTNPPSFSHPRRLNVHAFQLNSSLSFPRHPLTRQSVLSATNSRSLFFLFLFSICV